MTQIRSMAQITFFFAPGEAIPRLLEKSLFLSPRRPRGGGPSRSLNRFASGGVNPTPQTPRGQVTHWGVPEIQATVSELGFPGLRLWPQLGRVLTGSIGTDGVVRTSTSEVKFLDRGKTNFCESIRQECLH